MLTRIVYYEMCVTIARGYGVYGGTPRTVLEMIRKIDGRSRFLIICRQGGTPLLFQNCFNDTVYADLKIYEK